MTLLILSTSLFVFVLMFTIFFKAAKESDNKQRRLRSITGNYRSDFDEDLEKPFVQRFILPIFKGLLKSLSKLLPKNKGNNAKKLERNLKLAGINFTTNEYNAMRLVLICGVAFSSFIITSFLAIDISIKVLIVIISVLISCILPIYFIKFRVNGRQGNMRNQLPDVMDLLSVSIEAGLSFDLSLVKIGERLSGPLIDELNMVLIEIQLGRPRREALRSLSERTDVEDLRTFVSSIIQAEQLGIPIKNVLNSQAQQLRVTRRQKAEQKAMKAPVKMMIPLVAFVFPVLFIILLGPTILQVIKQFS